MKSAYCIAITACLTVIWLYEEKKKRGMAGRLCWKAAAGYLITRFVFFAISNQEVHGFLIRNGNGAGDSRTFIYFVREKRKPGISVGMPVSLYLESDPGIICSFTGKKADAFYLAGGIDSFHGQFVDRALQSAPWNRKIQKNWNSSHGCGNWHTLGAGYHRRALRTVQSGR